MSGQIVVGYYHFKTSPTKLVDALNARLGEGSARLAYYCGNDLVKTTNDDFLVNWGFAGRIWKTHKCPDINNRNTYDNKKQQKLDLLGAGISTPKVFDVTEQYPGVPVVLRHFSHHGGADALYVDSSSKWEKEWKKFMGGYCTEFVDKCAEYRAHQTKSGLLFATRKCIKNKSLLCWNNATEKVIGSGVSDIVLKRRLRIIAAKAIKAIGYDFGGVDIMMDDTGKMWIIEVNSAPALETQMAVDTYTNYVIDAAKSFGFKVKQ